MVMESISKISENWSNTEHALNDQIESKYFEYLKNILRNESDSESIPADKSIESKKQEKMIQTKDLEDDKNSKKSITPKDNRTLDASEIKKINMNILVEDLDPSENIHQELNFEKIEESPFGDKIKNTMEFVNNLEKNFKSFNETSFLENQIHEAPSYDEESRSKVKDFHEFSHEYNRYLDFCHKQVQTEDILFQKFLEKLKNIEEILNHAKPEEINEILAYLRNFRNFERFSSSNRNFRKKSPFGRTSSRIKRSKTDKNNIFPDKKIQSAPDSISTNEPPSETGKITKLSDIIPQIFYMNGIINQKQQEILSLDTQIDRKFRVLETISKKKFGLNKPSKNDRRQSDRIIREVPNVVSDAKFRKQGTNPKIFESESDNP